MFKVLQEFIELIDKKPSHTKSTAIMQEWYDLYEQYRERVLNLQKVLNTEDLESIISIINGYKAVKELNIESLSKIGSTFNEEASELFNLLKENIPSLKNSENFLEAEKKSLKMVDVLLSKLGTIQALEEVDHLTRS